MCIRDRSKLVLTKTVTSMVALGMTLVVVFVDSPLDLEKTTDNEDPNLLVSNTMDKEPVAEANFDAPKYLRPIDTSKMDKTKPASQIENGLESDLPNPKKATHKAFQEIEDLLLECRHTQKIGSLRVSPTIHFEARVAPVVTRVEFSRHENWTSEEVECFEQTFLSMNIEISRLENIDEPWIFLPRMEIVFTEEASGIEVLNRGPAYRLNIEEPKRVSSQLLSCVNPYYDRHDQYKKPGMRFELELAFDGRTGGLVNVVALSPYDRVEVNKCVVDLLLPLMDTGRLFSPVLEEDSKMICVFKDYGKPYSCSRLGPNGQYFDVSTEDYLASTH